MRFCTGVVRYNTAFVRQNCFRPLHFCTGVVPASVIPELFVRFRPLQFCTGVVQAFNLRVKSSVLDPCDFARV